MRKKIAIVATLLLVLALMTACGTKAGSTNTGAASVSENGNPVFAVGQRGIEFEIAEEYLDKGVQHPNYDKNGKGYKSVTIYYYGPEAMELSDKAIHATSEERANGVADEYEQKFMAKVRCLMEVTLVETDEYEKAMAAGGKAEDFTDFAPAEYYGTNEGYAYLVSIPELNDNDLSAEEVEGYHACKEYMQTVKKNLKFIPLESENILGDTMPEFKTYDLMGNEVTNEVFRQAELTVVNIWGTSCVGCVEEMPELAQMAEKYAGKVQFLGIVSDVDGLDDTQYLELAKKITEKAGVKYTNLVVNDDLEELMSKVVALPTTVLVDSSGNVIEAPIMGSIPSLIEEEIKSNLAANN